MDPEIVTQIIFLVSIASSAFVPYFYGSKIIEKSHDISFAIFDTPWYEMSPSIRKQLITIMIRAQSPPKITAGKLFHIKVHTYLKLLEKAYEFFTLSKTFIH